MKKFLMIILVLIFTVSTSIFFNITCNAMTHIPITQLNSVLKGIVGNWYDTKGNLVLTISDDYKFNGQTIIDIDYVTTTDTIFKIKIDDGKGYYKNIDLLNHNLDYHETLVLNYKKSNEQELRRTKKPRYVESVGKIYLGMDKNQVLLLYGQPSSNITRYGHDVWKYDSKGFDVEFEYGTVCAITLYKHSKMYFDRSKLSVNSSKYDFKRKYNNAVIIKENVDIGHGELIEIKTDIVSLRIFSPGYRF